MVTSLATAPLPHPPPPPRLPLGYVGQTTTLPLMLLHLSTTTTTTTLSQQLPPLLHHAMATTASRALSAITRQHLLRLPRAPKSPLLHRRGLAAVEDSHHLLATATTPRHLLGPHLQPSCPHPCHWWLCHRMAGTASLPHRMGSCLHQGTR